jgi:hypothetical protein
MVYLMVANFKIQLADKSKSWKSGQSDLALGAWAEKQFFSKIVLKIVMSEKKNRKTSKKKAKMQAFMP